jgi:hypothetical protein
LNKKEFDVILVKSDYFINQLILFNHGVFVNRLSITGLNLEYCFFINLKANLIDLHISRENVIENNKYSNLLYKIFNYIFDSVKSANSDPNFKNYISFVSELIESRLHLENFEYKDLQLKYPFLRSYLDNILFPVVIQGKLKYSNFTEVLESEQIPVYKCSSRKYKEEISLFCRLNKKGNAVFNPYKMPEISEDTDYEKSANLLEYIYLLHKSQIQKIDLRTLLLEISRPNKKKFSKILPTNIQFASFGKLKPFIVVLEYPMVSEKPQTLGFSYWGNILLWQKLTDEDRFTEYKKHFMDFKGSIYENISIVKEPVVLIDSSDPFISAIIDKYDDLKPEDCQVIQRYFQYLCYLPLVFLNIESCLIFIEAIENAEKQLSKSLSIPRPPDIFKRMGSNSSLYLQYFKNTLMDFETY